MKRLLWMALTIGFAAPLAAAATDSWVSLTGASSGGDGGEGVRTLVPIPGGYALGGPTKSYSGNGQTNFWLVLTDGLGNVTSQRSYYTGTEIFTNLNSMVATSDGRIRPGRTDRQRLGRPAHKGGLVGRREMGLALRHRRFLPGEQAHRHERRRVRVRGAVEEQLRARQARLGRGRHVRIPIRGYRIGGHV